LPNRADRRRQPESKFADKLKSYSKAQLLPADFPEAGYFKRREIGDAI
jgi:hypothetical protein